MKKRIAAFSAGVFLSLLFIFLLFKNLDFSKMLEYYSRMNFFWLIPFCAVLAFQLFLRAVKWRIMLAPLAGGRLYDIFRLETAGLAINNILPFRIGEIARAFMAARMLNVSSVSVLSTIVLERACDFLAMTVLFAFFSYIEQFSVGFFRPVYFLYIGLSALVFFAFMLFYEKILLSKAYIKFSGIYPGLASFSSRIIDGLRSFRSPLGGLTIISVAVVQWLCEALNNYMFALAFGLGGIVSFSRAALVLCSTAVGVSLPSAPGYFGNFEFAVVKLLSVWGIGKEAALAYASALHISGYVLMTGLGLFYVYSLGHSLSSIFEIGKKEK